MTGAARVAVIDIGKTNAKVALVDLAPIARDRRAPHGRTRRCRPALSAFRRRGLWRFILDSLAALNARAPRSTRSRHHPWRDRRAARRGRRPRAAGARLRVCRPRRAGRRLRRRPPALRRDRHAAPAARPQPRRAALLAVQHASPKPPPRRRDPDLPAILGLPPDRRRRHRSDLARLPHRPVEPRAPRTFSSLVEARGLAPADAAGRAPPPTASARSRPSSPPRPASPRDTPVLCGIHDSNASLLPHLRCPHRRPSPSSRPAPGWSRWRSAAARPRSTRPATR